MKVLIVCDPENTFWGTLKRFKRDGDEFARQAYLASDWYGESTLINLPKGSALEKRQALFKRLRKERLSNFDRALFFTHGSPRHLNRMMISSLNIDTFCNLLGEAMVPDGRIVFYSCKTAKLTDGFAANVAEKMKRDVLGHTTSGHTTRNPYKMIYFAGGKAREKLWLRHGGVKKLKNRLASSGVAPFVFVEEVMQ